MISYIDESTRIFDYDQWFITTNSLYTDTLTTLTNLCNDVKLQRTIYSLQGDIHSFSMFFKEPSLRNLTRSVLGHLGENRSPLDMEKLSRSQFILSPIHCVLLELALMDDYKYIVYRRYADRCPPRYELHEHLMLTLGDMLVTIAFSLEGHDQSCKDHVKMWCDNFLKNFFFEDDRYKQYATDMKRMLTCIDSDQECYLYYYFKTVPTLKEYVQDNTLPELKMCIQKGDGTPLSLPVEALHCTDNMAKYKDKTRKFSYNLDAVPSYGKSGHWYLVGVLEGEGPCSYSYDRKFNHIFISFIAHTQIQILNILEECIGAYLYFIPPCDCSPIKKKSIS